MFISVKWKSVAFLSIVLTLVIAAWTWQAVRKQVEEFESKLAITYQSDSNLIEELVTDSYLKLSQFAQLFAENSIIKTSLDTNTRQEEFSKFIEKQWLFYNINLGLDYLAVFDAGKARIGDVQSQSLRIDGLFKDTLNREIAANESGRPYSYIYCGNVCLLVVLEPFISGEGKVGTVVIAQNMADIVRTYFNFSGSGLGILIQDAVNDENAPRYLSGWDAHAWAVSDFRNVFPVLEEASNLQSIGRNDDNRMTLVGDKAFLIRQLVLPDVELRGRAPFFVSVHEETEQYYKMRSNIRRGIVTGVLGLLGAELVLWLILITPLNRLLNLTEALHLLPEQKFEKAISKIHSRKEWFPDELAVLESSTVYVANELDKLHVEISKKNDSLKEQVHALTRSRSFLTRLFDNAQIFIITQDFDFNILSTNKKFEALYQHVPRNFFSLISVEEDGEYFRQQVKALRGKQVDVFQQQIHQVDKDSREMFITWTHAVVESEQGEEILLSIGVDQTQEKKAEHDLRWMANHDSLTGVGNRRFFNNAFEHFLGSGVHGALVFIDVNRFKQINDIYGHSAGDQVLVEMSAKLRQVLRGSDVICRFAGDEFTALLSNIDSRSLPDVLNKLIRELNGTVKTKSGRLVTYSVSIGAAVFPDHGTEPQTLIINADMAMYNAKKKGVGSWHIFDANDERILQLKSDHNLILSIKNALKNESFALVYQPILDIEKQDVSHYEVLLRMFDEDGDMVSPALFIPVAERSGEIRRIDEWVLDRALMELRGLYNDGFDCKFSVNISAPTMQADDFPQMVIDAIEKYQIDPGSLIIELTETAYIENFQQVLKNLNLVTGYGVSVALDDFGVGFSSFTYLKMLPLSFVKLDGSYIQHLVDSNEDQVFVKSLASIIDAYGMKTIAEFVENQETLDMLAALGITYGQGYYIGKPAAIDHSKIRRVRV